MFITFLSGLSDSKMTEKTLKIMELWAATIFWRWIPGSTLLPWHSCWSEKQKKWPNCGRTIHGFFILTTHPATVHICQHNQISHLSVRPPSSSDLAHVNFYLFPKGKSRLICTRFRTVESVTQKAARVMKKLTEEDCFE